MKSDYREVARQIVAVIFERFGVNDAHIQSAGLTEDEIARALLDAHQRGRREGMEEAFPLLERLRHWIEDEVGAELPFTAEEQDAFYAIRSKMEEQP